MISYFTVKVRMDHGKKRFEELRWTWMLARWMSMNAFMDSSFGNGPPSLIPYIFGINERGMDRLFNKIVIIFLKQYNKLESYLLRYLQKLKMCL